MRSGCPLVLTREQDFQFILLQSLSVTEPACCHAFILKSVAVFYCGEDESAPSCLLCLVLLPCNHLTGSCKSQSFPPSCTCPSSIYSWTPPVTVPTVHRKLAYSCKLQLWAAPWPEITSFQPPLCGLKRNGGWTKPLLHKEKKNKLHPFFHQWDACCHDWNVL